MAPLLIVLLTPLTCAVTHILFQRLIAHRRVFPSRQKCVVMIIVLVSLANIILYLGIDWHHLTSSEFFYVAIGSLGAGHWYFHFFNMTETARRIRLLVTAFLGNKIDQSTSVRYDPMTLLEVRMQRLIDMGAVQEKNGRYFTMPGVMLFGALGVRFVRRIFY